MLNNSYSERAIPATLLPTKPKAIVNGITQEQIQIISQNTIAQPTPGGTEIQFYLPQLPQTFLDTLSSYFCFHVTISLGSAGTASSVNDSIYNNNCNGAILGGFYSMFFRMTVYANSVNVTDDIYELGLTAIYFLRLTMTKTARASMAYMYGFQHDPSNCSALAAYRIAGPFPQISRSDGYDYQYTNPNWVFTGVPSDWEPGVPQCPKLLSGNSYTGGSAATVLTQDFDIAIPVIGSLGVTNDNPYYLGLGNTRISLYTEDPSNFLLLPPVWCRASMVFPNGDKAAFTAGTPDTPKQVTPVVANINSGGLTLISAGSFTITRARFEAMIIRLDNSVWSELQQAIMSVNGPRLVSKVTSFTTTTQQFANDASGLQQPQMQIRRGSVKSVLITFNNTGTSTATSMTEGPGIPNNTTGAAFAEELPNYFKKYGSINPGLTANTNLSVNNVYYPKQGLDPTNYPSETMAYIMDCINMFNTSSTKPSISMQNWLVCDPNILVNNQVNQISSMWRSGAILNQPQFGNPGTVTNASACYNRSPWFVETLISLEKLTMEWNTGEDAEIKSNDFFLYFSLEDQPRPGMISGKSTMDGSNYLNAPLLYKTSYAYNVNFIAAFDALLVHEFDTGNVFYVS